MARLHSLCLFAALAVAPQAWAQDATPADESTATRLVGSKSVRKPNANIVDAPSFSGLNIGTLPAGKSVTIVFKASVNAGPFAAGATNLSNQGTATGLDGATPFTVLTDDPAVGGSADPTLTPLDAVPDLTLTSSDGGATTVPGGTVAYTLTYTNVGNQGAAGVVLTETVPASTTFGAGASTAGWSCVPNNNAGSVCTLAIGSVAGGGAGGTAVYAVTVVNPVAAGVVQISDSASIADDAANGSDPTPGNNLASDTTPVTAAPDLTLTKSDGGASVAAGGTVAYTLTYSNAGNQGATGVVLTETVPANSTFGAGASTAGWVCSPNNNAGSACTLPVGAVAGASGSLTATYAVTVPAIVPAGVTQISNTASVADDNTNGTDTNPGNNTGSDTTPVTAAPDLTIANSDGGITTTPGATVPYTLTWSNSGSQDATGVVLTETVPVGTTFNSGASTAGWVCTPNGNAGSTCTLALGSVPATGVGSSGTAVFAVNVLNPAAAGLNQISDTASIADDLANGTDGTPGNNSSTDTTPLNAAPDLAVTKSDGGITTTPGSTVAYVLSYSNGGNQGATGVVLSETVPANTTFNSGASTAGWVCTPNGNAGNPCTLTVGALAGGGAAGTATFAVNVVNPVPAGVAQISNTATIADDLANGADSNGANNTGSDTTPVTAQPDLSLTKSDGGATVNAGATVIYTLTYTNAGNQGATGVLLTETVPANSTFNAGSSTGGWSCTPNGNAGSTCTLAIAGAVNGGGGTGTALFAVTAVNPVPSGVSQISNTATVADDTTNGTDPNPANNTGSDTTPLNAAPDLTILKSDGGITTTPGSTVPYTLTWSNVGTQAATGVVITETVPVGSTFNAGSSTPGWVCTPNANAGSTCTLALGAVPATGIGSSGVATFAVTVLNPAPAGLNQLSNIATIADDAANGADLVPANNSSTDTTPVTAVPDLTLTKSDGGASVSLNGTVGYTLTISNVGNQDASGVVLTETVPADSTFNAGASTAGWSCTPNNNAGSACTLAVGNVGVGVPVARTFAVTVAAAVAPGVTQISNTASVADDGANGTDPTLPNTASDTTPISFCGDPADFIHTIQGTGVASTMLGQSVTIEGVVVGVFQGAGALDGFFVQEEDTQADADPNTSEGIFVYAPSAPAVLAGQVVRVQGTVDETDGLTQLRPVTTIGLCPGSPTAAATTLSFPVTALGDLERLEGMKVSLPQTLSVSGHDTLGTLGEVTLAQGGRLFEPTQTATPGGTAALALLQNQLRQIVLDDGSEVQNPNPVPYLAADNTLREGDTTSNISGVLSQGRGAYRVQPLLPVTFARVNARTAAPAAVTGTFKVANVSAIDYFNGNGAGGGFPGAGGASSAAEFTRQRDKLIAQIAAINADVVAVTDIENDATATPNSAVQDLVAGLNAVTAPGTYSFADTSQSGTPASPSAVALLFKPAKLTSGTVSISSNVAFDQTPLAVTFSDPTTGEKVNIVAAQFKSRDCTGAAGADLDQGDGQGCYNDRRDAQAAALLSFITTVVSVTNEDQVLLLGDLSAYRNEDPLTTLSGGGFTDLVASHAGANPYTRTVKSQSGYPDHALANAALANLIEGVTIWHANADEPRILDYNLENRPPSPDLYSTIPYRASEHDPIVIGLRLLGPANVSGTKVVSGMQEENGTITYTVRLFNAGPEDQLDNPGDELTDVLPASLTLVSATATAGTTTTSGNTVHWNGTILAPNAVVLTIQAKVNAGTLGQVISNQGQIHYDHDGDRVNEATALTDDPATPAANDPTSFTVMGHELVVNGSFENALSAWAPNDLGPIDGVDCTEHFAGNCSFRVDGVKLSRHGEEGKIYLNQRISVTGHVGDSFTFTAHSKASNSLPQPKKKYQVLVEFKNAGGGKTSRVLAFTRGTHTWETKTLTFSATKGYKFMTVWVQYYDQGGRVWFDGVSLRRN